MVGRITDQNEGVLFLSEVTGIVSIQLHRPFYLLLQRVTSI